jgi:hypothetical protein
MKNKKISGITVIGWFFLLSGSFSLINQLFGLTQSKLSVILDLLFIVNGYSVIKLKSFGKILTIYLSLFNLIYILIFGFNPKIPRPAGFSQVYNIYDLQIVYIWSSLIAMFLYSLIIHFFTTAAVEEQFIEDKDTQALKEANKKLSLRAQDLEDQVSWLQGTLEDKNKIIDEYRNKTKEKLEFPRDKAETIASLKAKREQQKKKIGEILLENNFITKDVLDRALEHQKQYGGTITQFLLHYGYIDERELASCLSEHFNIPYLPISAYDISDEIIKLIPGDIAEKYWLMPVDKHGDSLMVVMIDPLDNKIIEQLEELTGLKIKPFVGIISEIAAALQVYYKIFIKDNKSQLFKMPTFFVETKVYKGTERRESLRYNARIDVRFPMGERYKVARTINVSRNGFAIECAEPFAQIGAIITLEVSLPQKYSVLPITAVVQVSRCVPMENNKFQIAMCILKISKHELGIIIDYAVSHAES